MAFDNTTKHVIAESSLLKATITGRLINMVDTVSAVDNGKLVTKGAYLKDEVYAMGTPAIGNKVYLTLQVPLIYENGTLDQAEYNFYNAIGDIVRCYPLEENDIFTVSATGITALATDPVVGNIVVANGRNMDEKAAATDTTTYGFVGKIIAKVTSGSNITKYRIEVVKNKEV